jgi:hypothetical protein
MRQVWATLCVTSSLVLFSLGGSDSTGGFHLGTISVAGPSAILGPILDMVAVSCNVEGASFDKLGWHINSCLIHLFTAPARAGHFASLVVTPQGYKASGHHCTQPTSSCMISHHSPPP